MRTSLALILLAAACGGKGASTIGNKAPVGPLGPPPVVSWQATPDGDFTGDWQVTGTPALAADGSRVLIAISGGNGPVAAPNLALEVRGRDDQRLANLVVMTAEQGQAYGGGEDPAAAPDAGPANAWIATAHGQANYAPMVAATPAAGDDAEPSEDEDPPVEFTAGAIVVSFDASAHLVITDGGKPVLDRTMSAWQPGSYPMYDGAGPDEQCFNPIFLAGAYVDAAHKLAVLDVSFHGTDSCWEPDNELHVVTW